MGECNKVFFLQNMIIHFKTFLCKPNGAQLANQAIAGLNLGDINTNCSNRIYIYRSKHVVITEELFINKVWLTNNNNVYSNLLQWVYNTVYNRQWSSR